MLTYDQIFAADPANPSNIAQNAAVTIFAPGDVTMTPLTITDPDGQPLANPLTVNANGFGSAFAHATLDRVAWAGGGFTGFFTSYEGMKQVAVDAQAAAEAAAATAGTEAAAVATAATASVVADADAAATSAATAASNAAASATAAANSAALVGAPADTAVETLINSASATKAALNATYATPATVTAAVAPKLDSTTAAATYTARDTTALAGATLIGYGHSYVEGVGASTTANRFINRLATLLGATLSNRGVGGMSMPQTVHKIANGAAPWTPGTKSLVVLDAVLNDVLHTTAVNADQDRIGFENALRSALRILRAGSWVDNTDASCTYAGTWGTFTSSEPRGGTAASTTQVGATVTIAGYVPTEIVIMSFGTPNLQTAFDVTVGGTVYGGTIATGGIGAWAAVAPGSYQMNAYRVTGLPAGSKSIVVTNRGASGGNNNFFFDGYLTPPVTPPTVVVVRDAPIVAYATSPFDKATGDIILSKLNAVITRVVAESEFGGISETRVVDAGLGYTPDPMTLSADRLHRNDAGHEALAQAILRDAVNIPYRPGIW